MRKRKAQATETPAQKLAKMTPEEKMTKAREVEAYTTIYARLFRHSPSTGDSLSPAQYRDLATSPDKAYVMFYRRRNDPFPEVVRPFHRGGWLSRWESALMDGKIWEVTAEWEEGMGSDAWAEICEIEYGHDRIDIRRVANTRGFVRGVMRGSGMAYFPYYNDTKLDLSSAQIYHKENYPQQHTHCLQHTLLRAKAHMGDALAFEEKHVAGVITKYYKGGVAGSDKIPTAKLAKIGRDLACKFAVRAIYHRFARRQDEKERGKAELHNAQICPKSQEFGEVIPVGIINDHIFYDETWPDICSLRDLRIAAGLPANVRDNWKTVTRGSTPWTTSKIIHKLLSLGYLNEAIPPDVSKRYVKADYEDSTDEFNRTVDFGIVDEETCPDGDEDMEIHGSQREYKAPKAIKNPKPVYYYAADTETTTMGYSGEAQMSAQPIADAVRPVLPQDRHQIYLVGLLQFLTPTGETRQECASPNDVTIFHSFQDTLNYLEHTHREEADAERKKHKERKYWNKNFAANRYYRCDDYSLKVVLYFHNLKFDKAVIQSECRIHSSCDKSGQIYEFTILLQSGILVCCRDSHKHISSPLDKFQSVFGLPAGISKKGTGIIYEYFRPEKRGTRVTIDEYVRSTPRFFTESDADYVAKRNANDVAVLKACSDMKVNVECDAEGNMVFSPDELYEGYLRYDVLVLAEGLKVYRQNMIKVHDNVVTTGIAAPEPLSKLTSSAFSKMVYQNAGAVQGMYSYRSSLRQYIMSSVRGGRCTPHPQFKGKEIPAEVYYFDGVSLYPSSFVQQVREAGGFPKGPATALTPRQCEQGIAFLLSEEVSYAVVTVLITEIPKKLVFCPPIIAYKNVRDKTESIRYIQDLPDGEPIEVTVGLLDLLEYIKFHHIRFRVLHGCYWSTSYGFNTVSEDVMIKLHEIRKRHKPKGPEPNDALSNAYKLCSNSIYGTTIPRAAESKSEFWPMADHTEDSLMIALLNIFDSVRDVFCLGQSLQVNRESYDDSFTFCLVGSIVLSRSRWIMNGLWAACERVGAYIFYTDTDSVWIEKKKLLAIEAMYNTEREARTMPALIGSELCQFHNDIDPKSFGPRWDSKFNADNIYATTMFIVARKVYLLKTAYMTPSGETIHGLTYKCKGLPKSALEWYSQQLSLVPEDANLDLEHDDSERRLIQFYRDVLRGVAHEVPLNPKSTRFIYDKRRFVFTTTHLIPRTIKSKVHRATLVGYYKPPLFTLPAGDSEQEDVSSVVEACRLDTSHIVTL